MRAPACQKPVDNQVGPVCEAIRRILRDSGYRELREVEVSARRGLVRLAGTVRTFYVKQQAQQLAMSVDGVSRLENEMVVD